MKPSGWSYREDFDQKLCSVLHNNNPISYRQHHTFFKKGNSSYSPLQSWSRVLMGHYQIIMVHYSFGPVHIWTTSSILVRGRFRGNDRVLA